MNLFKKTSSHWVRYDSYEWKKDDKGVLYITPAEKAKPELYNPLKDSDKMVLHGCGYGIYIFLWTSWIYDSASHHTRIYYL